MQADRQGSLSRRRINEIRAKLDAGFYSSPGVMLKAAEAIIKKHPVVFGDRTYPFTG